MIAYERLAEDCDLSLYVTFAKKAAGEFMDEYLAEHAARGKLVILRGPSTDTNALGYYAEAMQALGPFIDNGTFTVVADEEVKDWRADEAAAIMDGVPDKHGPVSAVPAPNDDVAGGVVEALSRHALAGKAAVTGENATPEALARIREGTQGMTVRKDSDLMAGKTVDAVAAILANALPETGSFSDSGFGGIPTILVPVEAVREAPLP